MIRTSLIAVAGGAAILTACQVADTTAPRTRIADADLRPAFNVSFKGDVSEPFGVFAGVAFVRHTGTFEGETSLGAFRVPYEIVAPEDPELGNGTVLVEPPHFAFGTVGRDLILGRGFLLDRGIHLLFAGGYSHAAVGFGTNGLNILDPAASGLVLFGEPVGDPGLPGPDRPHDEDILVQFANALTTAPFAKDILGPIERRYAYGVSQTSGVLLNLLLGPEGRGLFDLTLLHLRFWPEPAELGADVFPRIADGFVPPSGIGKVMFIQSESELVRTDAEQLRAAIGDSDYRVYEVAGAPHLPQPRPLNPLDNSPVVRAALVAGDRWVREGVAPPPSVVLESAPEGEIDPVYGEETGIARDANLNALGGIRLPDLAVGRARFIAAIFSLDAGSAFPGTFGLWIDLACEPEPGSGSDDPRFSSHGEYVRAYDRQVNALRRAGYVLEADADALKERANESEVGKPGTCGG